MNELKELRRASDVKKETVTRDEYIKSLKPKFFSFLAETIENHSKIGFSKVAFPKGKFDKELASASLKDIIDLGYKVTLDEEVFTIDWSD